MDFNMVLMSIGDKLPRDGVASVTLKDKFEKLSEESQKNAITQLSVLNLKSPALVFWVGTFLLGALGVGRFMIGDMVLGFARLVLTVLGIVVAIFYASSMNDFVGLLYGLLALTNWIWWIVDMFLVGKKLRKKNYEKISAVFDNLK
ncbi:hypothetical protein F2N09_07045 [Campylobacter upsaliensis]|uniref:TM2 domain-containing protein n=1 Tax=Campylobacter upsaliensis TaxID=28080 RepID=A0A5M1DZR0_CAMUP|nr:hypothetical protein [Campylobacter upsaliensis]EAH5903461.1 hypothetical protein [Campylobacter upsaliensis]EAI2901305.1 hypothetical protein [Campylobacter upsaliensis]EAI9944530.1 hypothetical protein [Campylobacter upsaliensis]EAK1468162.1 hypothetical protein [Campylobacter upsaliensis]EAL3904665.1 hypothetical protein [Campylobacter upsaliensis]